MDVHADDSLFNEHGFLRPDGYQKILAGTVDTFFRSSGMDLVGMREKYGVMWVMLALNVQVITPVRPDENLTVRIWQSGRSGLVFRLETGAYHEDGTPALAAAKLYALMDSRTRRLKSGYPHDIM